MKSLVILLWREIVENKLQNAVTPTCEQITALRSLLQEIVGQLLE